MEPNPRYEPSEIGFDEMLEKGSTDDVLADLDAASRHAFLKLTLAGLFPSRPKEPIDGDWPLDRVPHFKAYSHQVEMLRRGIRTGTPGVVTSGTGSGKTESFLLPLIARDRARGCYLAAAARWVPGTAMVARFPWRALHAHKEGW